MVVVGRCVGCSGARVEGMMGMVGLGWCTVGVGGGAVQMWEKAEGVGLKMNVGGKLTLDLILFMNHG